MTKNYFNNSWAADKLKKARAIGRKLKKKRYDAENRDDFKRALANTAYRLKVGLSIDHPVQQRKKTKL